MPTIDLTKLLAALVKPKNWLYVILLAVIVWTGFKTYDWVWERGYAKRSAETAEQMATLTTERNDAVGKYAQYKGEYDNWVANTKKANEQFLREQYADLEARQKRLDEAEKAARNKPVTIKEVIKYVPAEVDATYRLPAGLVRLFVDTLEGRPSPFDPGTGISQSNPFNAGEASGLALSQFGQIAASNNAECVLRGKVIDEWQDWYVKYQAEFAKYQDWQKANAPKPAEKK